ncbi:hypothetical protein CY652_09075 [Burkholderia sp. WAC0059]|uniref:EAL domain-containing protein n=1 Tax=Burkholderia sp. WAC0059 TaxID=2066022 RepID=UPI000C7E99B2|nr:EAL domain-containing protein [Burkholderia sp. WAC0059]PLZ02682.1 hypothetical protein CY652_09075 [Burkholderia sp. WAC0059]
MNESLAPCRPRLRVVPREDRAMREPQPVCIVVSVDNYVHLQLAYGPTLAMAVRSVLHERLRTFCARGNGIVTASGPRFLLLLETEADRDDSRAAREAAQLDRVLSLTTTEAIAFGRDRIFPAVSARVADFADAPFDIDDGDDCIEPPHSPGKAWQQQYRSDMASVARLYASLDEGLLALHRDPVFDVAGRGEVLYHELLLRDRTGARDWLPADAIGALERTGLVRRLDCWTTARAVEALEVNATLALGCNISARSAVVDGYWAAFVEALRSRPDVAARLTIEITETAALPGLHNAVAFIESMRACGCRIALDDVGSHHSNLDVLAGLNPDVAKIGASWLHRARQTSRARDCFTRLVALASSIVPTVVVEGIETADDLRLAEACGARWGQGRMRAAAV